MIDGGSTNTVRVRENVDSSECWLFRLQQGYGIFAAEYDRQEEKDEFSIDYYTLTDGLETELAEEIANLDRNDYTIESGFGLSAVHAMPDGRAAAVHSLHGAEYGDGSYGTFLSIRVDPRT